MRNPFLADLNEVDDEEDYKEVIISFLCCHHLIPLFKGLFTGIVETALSGEEGERTGTQLLPNKCVKNPDFKHRGILAHWISHRFLSKHFINLLFPQPHVFFRLAYQSGVSKHKK